MQAILKDRVQTSHSGSFGGPLVPITVRRPTEIISAVLLTTWIDSDPFLTCLMKCDRSREVASGSDKLSSS